MNEPQWRARLNLIRETTEYADLLSIVSHHFRMYSSAEAFLGPYNAQQRSNLIYVPPSREQLHELVKQGSVNNITYAAFLASLMRFCEHTKGTRALPAPHPSTVHSIQLPEPAFSLTQAPTGSRIASHELTIPGAEPVYVQGVRNTDSVKFVIVRPKLGRNGSPMVREWEVLLFDSNFGYLPTWTDSSMNPRWSGRTV